jgi:hypothetical protein
LFFIIYFRLKEKQEERPESYNDILASFAMQSLPTEITDGEVVMVRNTIQHIPQTQDHSI